MSIEENGANTLYIALGLLKWYESERSRKARYAPLLLLPVEIIRKGGNQGYVIRRRDEETQMNITVLEKLNQDFQIRIAGLETLPIDEHGIDTRKTFTIIRKGIMNQPRWDVLESAYIGIFSFSQFVMWNDIKNRADDLARNKIVRSLMEGKLVWKPESMNLNEYVPANDLYLPVSVDGSQMYAVDSAAKGKSFVLHGPPGTGKSQTITVMIANALAQGKTVLFVAEKMAALSVVQKRLNDIGLGSFCLELHSNKAKKKDVLEQLRQASEVVKGTSKEEYERIKSNGRGLSIRSLLDQIPTLLPRLCPCMLMSPLSVAQYLDPNRTPFDLVIFDEASQLPTSKAVGALARGEEAIIVGDPKQMPPTSFFASNMFDEENADTEDLESILDDCLALNMPETHLLWHYRSKHESLIAFSNNQFYENKLYTFPSVNDRESKVTLVKVNGIFERGKKRFNKKEAELIVEEVKRRAKDDELRKYSVGIVTFNINQQNLIDDMLNDACAEDPELESWIYNETEPVFIKNLENVQGDERDVILFSISYGPDEDGKISMNFGPLNREGGWRRLNVAVSRARYEMKVFSSLSADQINLSRTKAEGVVALKEFLEYAAGKTTLLDEITIKGKGVKATGIAGTIKAFLKNNGYESDILVGRSEFKIDVGVINPGNTENYILGIILDGDSYNAAKTTRDRELAQIAVLNGLGWNIHRIWTMDWYDNQVKELNKLLSLLDELKNTSEKKTTGGSLAVTPKTSAVPIQKNVIEKVVTAEQKKKYSAVVYESVVLSYTPMSADNMLDYHSDEIRKRITQIIQKEGPVCEKFLYKKVVQSFGVTRVGSRIQGRLEVLVGNNRDNVTKQESGKVFWPAGINPDNYYGFRASGENENKRDAKDVPVYEALNAMSYILFNDISVEEEDLIREAAKLMGYARVGTGVSTLFKTALKLGCKNGRLIKEDIRWKLTEEGNIFAKNLGSNVVCEEIVSEELNDELDDIDTTTSKLVAKNIKAKEIAKKCALDKITNCDSNCKFYFTCSHAGD